MKIINAKINNFRSIEATDLSFDDFNVFVGQNNHGKTNFFEALYWFFKGYRRLERKQDLIFSDAGDNDEIIVELTFSGLQESIENMTNTSKKTALQKKFSDNDQIKIRRTTEFDDGKKRELYNIQKNEWENIMGADGTWNDLLPHLEYVHTKVTLDDIGGYKSKSPISEMLSGVLTSIVENDPKYVELSEKFESLFGDSDSEVRVKLDELGEKVEIYLKKQFPDDARVKFNVDIPEFNDMFKKFSTEVDDGTKTTIEEKGDGMQRAVMLSIIQAYADFRKENDQLKKFIFLIDEAEVHLHPSAQRFLKSTLLDISQEGDQVFINTHSSVLVTDNVEGQKIFKVEKSDKRSSIEFLGTEEEKMNVVFDLLGGTPADLLFPHNIGVVEGSSDGIFLSRCISFLLDVPTNKKHIIFHHSSGDSRAYAATVGIDEMLKTASYIPVYRNKICVLVDSNVTNVVLNKIQDFLSDDDQTRVVRLTKPGIEYYYPNNILNDVCELDENVNIENELKRYSEQTNSSSDGVGNLGSFNGTKSELAQLISDNIENLDFLEEEIKTWLNVVIQKAY